MKLYKALFLHSLIILSFSITAQTSPVTANVTCTNFSGQALIGEQIWFQEVNTKKIYKGVSDQTGHFSIEIQGPGIYMIMIKSIGDASDYSKFSIPKLNPGETYGAYNITVEIDPAKEFTLDHVFFETAKSTLKKESFEELDELVELLNNKKSMIIEVGGHTDSDGSEEANQILSKNRAESVKKYLIQKVIDQK